MRRKVSDNEFSKLAFLIEQAYTAGGKDNEFVRSCEMFLITRRYLTKKQITALHKVEPPRIFENWYMNDINSWRDEW